MGRKKMKRKRKGRDVIEKAKSEHPKIFDYWFRKL